MTWALRPHGVRTRGKKKSGSVDTEISQIAEQRAMQMVHRYQTLSVEMIARASAETAERLEALPPAAPPVSLYTNLPQEWPLARLSVQLRHIGVLHGVTLYRRVAELSFRGVDFRQLPREVMKDICHEIDNICGEMAKRLASLFAFLKPASNVAKDSDPMGLSLYADPAYWLYGLLSFCAKACESKTAEANLTSVLGARDERGARQRLKLLAFFFARVGALCVPRGTSHRVEFV